MQKRGYGVINYKNRTETVHRLLYAAFIKPLPQGVGHNIPVLDHIICDNRACCNPYHLLLGPQKRNILRSLSPSGINSRKTHCIKNHLLPNKPNEYGKNPTRRCIICRKLGMRRRYYERKKNH